MRFFDAHCDTVQKVVEKQAGFAGDTGLHVTLGGMLEAGMSAQVFAAWVYAERARGHEYELAMQMVETVQALCRQHSGNLIFARGPGDIQAALEVPEKIAAIASLEGADPLMGDLNNLAAFFEAGVRLLTLAWGDNPFCGTVFGGGSGLTKKGEALVQLCEEMGVVVDVSHASDQAFFDVVRVAHRPFVASHSNCRAISPNDRNLTDEMIRTLGERGGVMGINMGSGFLSADFFAKEKQARDEFFRAVKAGEQTFDEALETSGPVIKAIPRPPFGLILQHVKHAIKVGGEDCVGLGGDLDGVESTPTGLDSVRDYAKIEGLLLGGGLVPRQVEKVCHGNFERLFIEVMGR